jgi:hypothetical protein
MATYIEAHPPLRNTVVGVALLLLAGGLLLKLYAGSQVSLDGSPAEVVRRAAAWAGVTAVFFTLVFAAWSALVLWLTYRTITSRTWPPAGVPVPLRLRVVTNPRRSIVLLVAVLFILGKGAIAWSAWWSYWSVQQLVELVAK